MTRHLGSLTSFPLSEYIGPVGREMRGRAAQEKVVIFVMHDTIFSGSYTKIALYLTGHRSAC